MAFNFQTFKTRTLTALLFVAVMLTGLLWNFWSFLILFTVIHFGCWYEYLKLSEKINTTTIDNFVKWFFAVWGYVFVIFAGIRHFGVDIEINIGTFSINLKWLFFALFFAGLTIFAVQNKMIPAKTKWMVLGGFVYISFPITLLINLRDSFFLTNEMFTHLDFGKVLACSIIFSIWINDTMAYLVGSFVGKTPLTKVSPKKTWEGTIGGVLLCVVVIALVAYLFKLLAVKDAAIIAILCSIFGTLGDLFESKLKRMADVKDSGSFMPGHGGFLDRFDSLLLAVPAVWVYVQFFL